MNFVNGWWADALNFNPPHAFRSPNFAPGNAGRRAVVLHITDGTDSRGWLSNPRSKVSSHFLNRDEGVYQLVSVNDTAFANGLTYRDGRWIDPERNVVRPPWPGLTPPTNPNYTTISIENEGRPGKALTARQQAQLLTLLRALAAEFPQFRPYVAGDTLIGHNAIGPIHRANCPGRAFDLAAIAAAANATTAPPPPADGITADATILAMPRATPSQMLAYLTRRSTGGYTRGDLDTIVRAYVGQAVALGVDPLVAVAQMIHETGGLTSWWAQRPRRNPAGIGVTGETSHLQPKGMDWRRNDAGLWVRGLAFASWAGEAIPAHLGRLLAYATHPEARTPVQAAAVQRALAFRDLPISFHGTAPRLKALGKAHNPLGTAGAGWASPGESYGHRIAAIMRAIAEVAP